MSWVHAQEAKKEEKKVTVQDSTKKVLRKEIYGLLQKYHEDMVTDVLKSIVKDLTPKKIEAEPLGWSNKGKYSLFFNQSAFNNEWQGGGTSNIAGNTSLNYELRYKKKNMTWENKFWADYGLTFLRGENFARKTNDRIELNTRLEKQIGHSNWNYSFFLNFRSQFAKGYRFETNENEETIRIEETHFFSPATIQTGPGFLWKKNNNFNVNLAPVTSRMIFVDRQFTSDEDYKDGDYFGVDAGESSRFEFGGSLAAYAKLAVVKNLTVENTLNLYSNYIEDYNNVDIDYTLNINLVFNKYISSNFVFQAIYDDNAINGFQVREVIGLGLNYEL